MERTLAVLSKFGKRKFNKRYDGYFAFYKNNSADKKVIEK
jgi:hypothetical protein